MESRFLRLGRHKQPLRARSQSSLNGVSFPTAHPFFIVIFQILTKPFRQIFCDSTWNENCMEFSKSIFLRFHKYYHKRRFPSTFFQYHFSSQDHLHSIRHTVATAKHNGFRICRKWVNADIVFFRVNQAVKHVD